MLQQTNKCRKEFLAGYVSGYKSTKTGSHLFKLVFLQCNDIFVSRSQSCMIFIIFLTSTNLSLD